MPRGGQVGRWLVILDELRAARLGIPAELLARRHGWQARTVYRDLRALEEHGSPLPSIGGRWRLVAGWQHALPARLAHPVDRRSVA